ncbi:MAG TPA: S-adenosylmethionine:tRNA ribosyltransferase-isomerase [Oligoflexus sp.]|uniref:S-adenosylmethionine:tRNA ribosyltransferase-isomerase n=1 Tax=Oligoflexus sp. TaxID=1971216 RepID=UPI002D6613E8|nr:S-adenosylmethionine:tRNA ribosyltransferase-isomerase [Oligoflexus sp.]HYX33183.1 S-adenosylmethionine:tRNA ribosyltransferase-isomerase [Oligoflexus sp.]
MIPAQLPQRFLGKTKLMILGLGHGPQHRLVEDLPSILQPRDLLIVNRSATLPSSFRGHVQRSGEALEIRLASFQGHPSEGLQDWLAFSFGSGDWRMPTEERGPPPSLQSGDTIIFGDDLTATVQAVEQARLLHVRFQSLHLEQSLYRHGRPIQYSYLQQPLDLWDQQTLFAGPPLSTEAPSAAFPFNWDLVLRLKARGIKFAPVLHAAGLSSTGSAALDQLLPLPEYFEVPWATVRQIETTLAEGGRIIALGTSALRALESAWVEGALRAGSGMTPMRLGPSARPHIALGLITGMHELGTSHRQLLTAFLPEEILSDGFAEAERNLYRSHEYGDLCLVFSEEAAHSR